MTQETPVDQAIRFLLYLEGSQAYENVGKYIRKSTSFWG